MFDHILGGLPLRFFEWYPLKSILAGVGGTIYVLTEASVPELAAQTDMGEAVQGGVTAGNSSSIESLGAINNS